MNLYNFILSHSIIISVLFSLLITILPRFIILSNKTIKRLIAIFILLVLILSFKYIYLILFIFPLSIIPIIIVILIFIGILVRKDSSEDKIESKLFKFYLSVIYFCILSLLLFAILLSSSSANTWGTGYVYIGVFMIIFIIPLLHLIRLLHNLSKTYGIINIIFGFISMFLIAAHGFTNSEYNGSDIQAIRTGIVLIIMDLIIEGFIFLLYPCHHIKQK